GGHARRHLRAADDDGRGRAAGGRAARRRRCVRPPRAHRRARAVQADAAPDRRPRPAPARPVEQADRARARPLGRDRQGPRRRSAARARRQLAHAGRPRGEPAVEPGGDRAVAHAPSLSGAGAPPASVDAAARDGVAPLDGFLLLRDHVRGTFAFNRTTLAGHAIGAIIVEMVFASVAPLLLRVVWGVAFAIVWLGRAWLALRFARDEPTTSEGLSRRLRTWQAGVLASGALWGVAAWFFSAYGGGLHRLALVVVVYTFCVACVPILAPQFRLFVLFVVLVFVPAIVRVALQDDTLGWQVAVVMAVAMAMTMLLGRNYRQSFESIVGLKLRTEALAVQLGAEKAVADAARAEAEVANRAKTQFFAAASHDLRQPLHAMGLFAEALRARSHD